LFFTYLIAKVEETGDKVTRLHELGQMGNVVDEGQVAARAHRETAQHFHHGSYARAYDLVLVVVGKCAELGDQTVPVELGPPLLFHFAA
jgi:hypothetical protein